jgi:uncharacterized membrane protein
MYVPAVLIAAFSIPLALKLVPPNRLYGVRTARTLADRQAWFQVNRFAGFALIVAVAAAMCFYVLEPELASGRSLAGVLALIVPVMLAIAATLTYGRALSRRTRRSKR